MYLTPKRNDGPCLDCSNATCPPLVAGRQSGSERENIIEPLLLPIFPCISYLSTSQTEPNEVEQEDRNEVSLEGFFLLAPVKTLDANEPANRLSVVSPETAPIIKLKPRPAYYQLPTSVSYPIRPIAHRQVIVDPKTQNKTSLDECIMPQNIHRGSNKRRRTGMNRRPSTSRAA